MRPCPPLPRRSHPQRLQHPPSPRRACPQVTIAAFVRPGKRPERARTGRRQRVGFPATNVGFKKLPRGSSQSPQSSRSIQCTNNRGSTVHGAAARRVHPWTWRQKANREIIAATPSRRTTSTNKAESLEPTKREVICDRAPPSSTLVTRVEIADGRAER
jgi:hypothetical protein